MAVQAIRQFNYQPAGKNLLQQAYKNNDQSQAIASKIALQASMERALLNQKYWEDLLEKLRKMGGGGGSSMRFDRITVSMQLMSFLSNKTILAMIKNFNEEFLNTILDTFKQLQGSNQNIFAYGLQKIVPPIVNGFINLISLFPHRDATTWRLYNVSQYLNALAGILSFQLNKLKEILEEDLKELIRKLDLKEKIKKIKTVILDFFVDIGERITSLLQRTLFLLFPYLKNFLPSINTGTPRITL